MKAAKQPKLRTGSRAESLAVLNNQWTALPDGHRDAERVLFMESGEPARFSDGVIKTAAPWLLCGTFS